MFDIKTMLYSIPAVIIGLTLHEFMHAFAAYKMGDSTAKDQGRLTLNPLKHIDLLGMVFIIIAGFGWAKPVQFNPANLKRPKLARAVIALAGPFSNLALGSLMLLVLKLLLAIAPSQGNAVYEAVLTAMVYFGYINFGLFVFNMLPIPPLDGSHILFQGLNLKPETEMKFYKYGTYALFAVILLERRASIDILPITWLVEKMVGFFL